MKYHLVKAGNVRDLEKYVNHYLENGWTLHGNPFNDAWNYYQAMIKENE